MSPECPVIEPHHSLRSGVLVEFPEYLIANRCIFASKSIPDLAARWSVWIKFHPSYFALVVSEVESIQKAVFGKTLLEPTGAYDVVYPEF